MLDLMVSLRGLRSDSSSEGNAIVGENRPLIILQKIQAAIVAVRDGPGSFTKDQSGDDGLGSPRDGERTILEGGACPFCGTQQHVIPCCIKPVSTR